MRCLLRQHASAPLTVCTRPSSLSLVLSRHVCRWRAEYCGRRPVRWCCAHCRLPRLHWACSEGPSIHWHGGPWRLPVLLPLLLLLLLLLLAARVLALELALASVYQCLRWCGRIRCAGPVAARCGLLRLLLPARAGAWLSAHSFVRLNSPQQLPAALPLAPPPPWLLPPLLALL
jgi:hypothetical protein